VGPVQQLPQQSLSEALGEVDGDGAAAVVPALAHSHPHLPVRKAALLT
jgi:hypothetical protein